MRKRWSKKNESQSMGQYPYYIETKHGPGYLIGITPDMKEALVSFSRPKEKQSKTKGPCFNKFIKVKDLPDDVRERLRIPQRQ